MSVCNRGLDAFFLNPLLYNPSLNTAPPSASTPHHYIIQPCSKHRRQSLPGCPIVIVPSLFLNEAAFTVLVMRRHGHETSQHGHGKVLGQYSGSLTTVGVVLPIVLWTQSYTLTQTTGTSKIIFPLAVFDVLAMKPGCKTRQAGPITMVMNHTGPSLMIISSCCHGNSFASL